MIKKSDLNLIPSSNPLLSSIPNEFNFNGDIDANMLANMMFDRMNELGGVGLSANQVGLNIRMFVMGINDVQMAIFNPVILDTNSEEVSHQEGCLSFPGIFVQVKRPKNIHVKFYNVKGEERSSYLEGLTARVFLHEYDHMCGITMNKRVSKLKWDLAVKKYMHKKHKIVKKHSQQILQEIAHVEHSNQV